MAGEQHQRGHDHDPGNAADRADPSVVTSVGHLVGDLAAHQQRRDAGRDLHHRQRHDEGGDADHRQPERVDEAEQGASASASRIAAHPGIGTLAMLT